MPLERLSVPSSLFACCSVGEGWASDVFKFILSAGMLESCVAPILILIVSMFYKKDEQAQRISWFYLMVSFAPQKPFPHLTLFRRMVSPKFSAVSSHT